MSTDDQATDVTEQADTAQEESPAATIQVIRGSVTPEEAAALTLVFTALSGNEAAARRKRGGWSARRRVVSSVASRPTGWGAPGG